MNYSDKSTWIERDFQGWPICKRTLKELFEDLGLILQDGSIYISADNPILNVYPERLTDDGMGYGVDEEFFTCASFENDKLYFFTEPYNKEQVDSLK